MRFTVVTLFPELVEGFCAKGLLGAARDKGIVKVECLNPRQFTSDNHATVDDRAFGGGDGMVMKAEPLALAVESLKSQGPIKVVVLTPQGRVWNQQMARQWADAGEHIVLVSGRYAGLDHRFAVQFADEEVSLGDFVLNGGEVAALAVIESVTRLCPGVLGNELSSRNDSFSGGGLEAPQFTRPREWRGLPVPSPLVSGHHADIDAFLAAAGLVRTALSRPELVRLGAELDRAVAAVAALTDLELRSLGMERRDLLRLCRPSQS